MDQYKYLMFQHTTAIAPLSDCLKTVNT